jgi:hypothetical protein
MRPRSMVRPLLLVAPLLVATIAATLVAVFSPEAPPRRAGAVDFDTGTLQGTVSWNGTPVTGLRSNYYYSSGGSIFVDRPLSRPGLPARAMSDGLLGCS